MATKVVMEALSPTMEEGRLVEWKKGEGDPVAVGDVLAEVETDKAVMELVARAGGTLLKQVVPAGTTVPVSQLVALIGEPGEAVENGKPAPVQVTYLAYCGTTGLRTSGTVGCGSIRLMRKASWVASSASSRRRYKLGASQPRSC
jgi:pyruvate/2-oxoglutarate dehydrogenase complex dihydrolipoamide acyltransferase (E2) component